MTPGGGLMKYGVWFVRLIFAAWMIPAGLNHFIPIFPQPMGSKPLSHELIVALIDSHLFDIVKAVELLAGICVLTGFFIPLALLVCMPVSFCVFWWDTPLEGWGSGASVYGESVLACNVLLCLAYFNSYRSMFKSALAQPKQLVLAGRLVFGAWMLANGINHFFLHIWATPTGHEPMAMQLMGAFVHSGLFDVAMLIELVTGALLLAGLMVPAALCVVMPVSVCALYWSVILEHQPLGAVLALAAFVLNGLLMLAWISSYKGALQRHVLTPFESLFVNPNGRTSRSQFVPALISLLAAVAFYAFLVTGLTAQWCMLVLLFPFVILNARRLHDMGYSAWLLLVPAVLLVVTFCNRVHIISLGDQLKTVPMLALAVAAAFALWGCICKSRKTGDGT
jgi:uncharacterized membrane protein YhaH (DUF805 family)/uncharacterized membrane protein YphA (DoxX/SURF4 family)